MTKQAVNYLLGQMEQLGYLTRNADPEDQRSKRIHSPNEGTPPYRTSATPSARSKPSSNESWGQSSSRNYVSW
jgi:hypothetical protein